MLKLVGAGEISNKLAKEIFEKMFATGEAAPVIIEREGLKQISDTGALEKIVDEVIAANPKQLEQYRAGKTTVMGFFVGQIMKATKGQANPAAVNELLKKKIMKEGDKAPPIHLQTDTGEDFDLAGLKGKKVVLFFYPRASTPGCTIEACEFRDDIQEVRQEGRRGAGYLARYAQGPDELQGEAEPSVHAALRRG